MKKTIFSLLLAATVLSTLSLQAQTAGEIVDKYIAAIGGKDKLNQITSVYLEGAMQIMGNESPTKVIIVNGKGYKTESEFNGAKMIQCFTDKGGWSVNPMSGGGAEAMPDELYKQGKEQMNIGGALFDYAAKGSTVELQGKEGGAYKLKVISKEKDVTTCFIDASTYYLTKLVKKGNMMGQEVEITIQFSDYKKTDFGYVIPFAINTDLGQFQVGTTFSKAEINKTIDPSVFEMPK